MRIRFQADADLNQIIVIWNASQATEWTNRLIYLPL